MLNSCLFYNSSNSTNGLVSNILEVVTAPSYLILIVTFFFGVVNFAALISAQFYRSSNAVFYFNLTVADIFMAIAGISGLAVDQNYKRSFEGYENFGRVLFVLRFDRFNVKLLKVILINTFIPSDLGR